MSDIWYLYSVKTSELEYHLPTKLIAQEPVEPRDSSKLLVLDKQTGLIEHRQFKEIEYYLKPNDLLVVNDTKVLPARLSGRKQDTGAKVEILLLSETANPHYISHRTPSPIWEVLAKPVKRLKSGNMIIFDDNLKAEVVAELSNGRRLLNFTSEEPLINVLQRIGQVPLPPYIVTPLLHPERYQTIYARKQQSAAAPTAGLHFTTELIKSLKAKGVKFAHVTLRIGLDTFQPIREEEVENHHIHSEYFEVGKEAADSINEARESSQRIIAVGTTSARVLETLANKLNKGHSEKPATKNLVSEILHYAQNNNLMPFTETTGYSDLFIYPGYNFKVVDAMITNFHLPRTTLLAMVSAFANLEQIKKAYNEAILHKYRFFSFGDAMLIF